MNETANDSGNWNIGVSCGKYDKHNWLLAKFILLSVCGTSVAIFGIFGNFSIALVLLQPAMRTANNLYLTVLAVFDSLVLLSAVMLYSVEYINEYFDYAYLYVIWVECVPYCYVLSNFAQTGSVYLTVSLTFERYLAVLYPKIAYMQCTRQKAIIIIILVITFAAAFNFSKFFELDILYNDYCDGFSSKTLNMSNLLQNQLYTTVYSFWLTQITMVFFPFIALFTINSAIVINFRRSLKRINGAERGRLKAQSKDATRVLVIIVAVFLLCNFLGFAVALLEITYGNEHLTTRWPQFYAFSREAINFLAIVNSSINFVICYVFGEDFRNELQRLFGCRSANSKTANGSMPHSISPSNESASTLRLRYVDRISVDELSEPDEPNKGETLTALFGAMQTMMNGSTVPAGNNNADQLPNGLCKDRTLDNSSSSPATPPPDYDSICQRSSIVDRWPPWHRRFLLALTNMELETAL